MPRDHVGVSEHVKLGKTKISRVQLEVKNTCTIIAEKKDDPSQRRVVAKKVGNNVLDGGIDLLLDLLSGANTTDYYDAGSYVEFLDSAGSRTTPGTMGPTDSGPQNGGSCTSPCNRRRWEWHDESTDEYSFQQIAMYQMDPDSGTGTPVQFNQFDFGSSQDKPSDENWHIVIEVEFSSTNSNFSDGGMQRLAMVMSAEVSSPFDETNVTIIPVAGDGTQGSEISMDSAPSVDKSNNNITMEFTSVDGNNEQEWDTVQVIHDHGGADVTVRDGGCKDDGSSCGTKASAEEWTWRHILQF